MFQQERRRPLFLSFALLITLTVFVACMVCGAKPELCVVPGSLTLLLFLAQQIAAARDRVSLKNRLQAVSAQLQATQDELRDSSAIMMAANARLEALAITDGLTGLANHRAFQMRLQEEMARVQRYGPGVAVILADVDYFKHYNDSYGHPAGDDILRGVGQLLQAHLRESDFVARYGGEEFALLLPQTDLETCRAIADRLRELVARYDFPHRQITLSMGMAWHPSEQGPNDEIVVEADQALYAAKRSGRNCVVVAREEEATEKDIAEEAVRIAEAWEAAAEEQGATAQSALAIGENPEALLQEPAGQLLCGLLAALDLREAEPEGHCLRVVRFALRLAHEVMRLDERTVTPGDLRELAFGALLHDIGKTGIPDALLRKAPPLTQDELEIVRQHAHYGAALLQPFPLLEPALPVVRNHHERWDGTGYPLGLTGEDIPVSARIFALADTLDAMSKRRPCNTVRTDEEIRTEIQHQAGLQFDPVLVRAFLQIPVTEWEPLRNTHADPVPEPDFSLDLPPEEFGADDDADEPFLYAA